MLQRPVAVGLKLSKMAVVEEKTRNVTLVNCFRRLKVVSVAETLRPFVASAILTDGLGVADFALTVTRLETMENVHEQFWQGNFFDPMERVWLLFPIEDCLVPAPGRYQITLSVESEPITHCILEILEKGSEQ
jgi:hypothetical protein